MGEFEGVKIFKSSGGTGRNAPGTDAVMALVAYSPVMPGDVTANSVVETIQLLDAQDKGINASFDANNNVLIHHHIDEFYRLAPDGELFVILTDQTTPKAFFESTAAKSIFRTIEDVKRIGFVLNSDPAGLNLDEHIAASQVFINDLAQDHILIDGVYLEARNIAKNAEDKRELNAPNVSLVAFQDPAIAKIHVSYSKYAAVGTVMGSRAVRKVNEDLGSVDIINKPDSRKGTETYPISSINLGRYTSVSLSDGTDVKSLTQPEKNQLTERGYIYAGKYQGFAGVYLNTEPTCIAIESDYSFGNNNGVWNKAARGIRLALLPKVKSILKRDGTTGNITSASVSSLELLAERPLKTMISNDEISDAEVYISADQNPSDQVPLKIKGSVTKDGIVFNFEVELGLK